MKKSVSTIDFTSNVYPVAAEEVLHDERFLRVLRDPGLLRLFKQKAYRVFPDAIQEQIILKGIGTPCSLDPTKSLSWGTAVVGGSVCVVCRCEQADCRSFASCRKDLSPDEVASLRTDSATTAGESAKPAELSVRTESHKSREAVRASAKQDPSRQEPPSFGAEPQLSDPQAIRSQTQGESRHPLQGESRSQGKTDREAASPPASGRSSHDLHDDAEPIDAAHRHDDSAFMEDVVETTNRASLGPLVPTETRCLTAAYDEHQARVVEADPAERLYVNAGPGAGKTHTLIEKVKHMINERDVDPEGVTVLSFTKAAVRVVQDRLSASAKRGEMNVPWQGVDVTTFDKLCTRLLYAKAEAGNDQKLLKKIPRLDYDERVVEARKLLEREPEWLEGCSHVIVDETQDLVGCRAEFVLSLLKGLPSTCGFTLLGDKCQAIYDYQLEDKKGSLAPGGMSSAEFIVNAVRSFAPTCVRLEKNYRQKSEYPLDLTLMREALLNDDINGAKEQVDAALSSLGKPTSALGSMEDDTLRSELISSAKKTGILARSNAEAIEIESLLWKRGIRCEQSRSDASNLLTRRLADVFFQCDSQTIDRVTFEEILARDSRPDDGRIWQSLITLNGVKREGARLRIENVLEALCDAMTAPELAAVRDSEEVVSVSTVHKAKGKEFDCVWLLSENFDSFANADKLEELRVAYVALSRAVSDVSLQCLDAHHLIGGKSCFYTAQMYGHVDRYYKKKSGRAGISGKSKVANFEILNERDVDFGSFGNSPEAQELLRCGALEGREVRLEFKGSTEIPIYAIYLADEDFELGKLQPNFANDYKTVSGKTMLHYPDAFDNVFIDRIVTCVAPAVAAPDYAKKFGDMAVWYGAALGGFAHRDDSQGY